MTRPPSAAIIGAGAIGMMLGAALSRAGFALTVCGGRSRVDHFEVVTQGESALIPVSHASQPCQLRRTDLVVLAVKAQDTPAVGPWLAALADPSTTVVVAQNGVEHHERVAPWVADSKVVPAVVYAPVERTGPGRAVVHRPPGPDLSMPAGPAAGAVAELLSAGGLRIDITHDFRSIAWRKLLTNLVSGPITTLTGRRLEVFDDPAVARFAGTILREGLVAGRAEGATIEEDQPERTIAWLRALPEGSTTSMAQDREAGRPLEHDALTGAVLRAARRHGLAIPAIEGLHALLDAASQSAPGRP